MGTTEMGSKFVNFINVLEYGPLSISCKHDNGFWTSFPGK
jgi:hypothetical protein